MSEFDWSSRAGAEILATRIQTHWKRIGCTVKTKIVGTLVGENKFVCVRSDMLNGYPRDMEKEEI